MPLNNAEFNYENTPKLGFFRQLAANHYLKQRGSVKTNKNGQKALIAGLSLIGAALVCIAAK